MCLLLLRHLDVLSLYVLYFSTHAPKSLSEGHTTWSRNGLRWRLRWGHGDESGKRANTEQLRRRNRNQEEDEDNADKEIIRPRQP